MYMFFILLIFFILNVGVYIIILGWAKKNFNRMGQEPAALWINVLALYQLSYLALMLAVSLILVSI